MVVQCAYCKKKIDKRPRDVEKYKNSFCDRECSGKWRKENENVNKNCIVCNKEFKVNKSRDKTAKFCSVECHDKHQRKSKNKPLSCTNCGKEIPPRKPSMIKNNNFCCNKCVGEWNAIQKNTRVSKTCTICGKEYKVKKCYSESSVACSRKCQGKWFSQYYAKDNKEYEEFRREVSFKVIEKQRYKSTKPERAVEQYLIENNFTYVPQQMFYDKFVVDFYLPEKDIIIEVQGNYWHGNPNIFGEGENKKPLSDRQKKQIGKDKGRFEYLSKAGHVVYPVWEQDIYDDINNALYFLN